MTTSEKVASLAKQHGIEIASDQAAFLAREFSRLEGIDGDRTLELIADMMRTGILSDDDGTALALAHVRESRG